MIEASEQREPVDVALLRRFVPMDALSGTSLERLCKVSMRLRFAAGARPFRVEQPLSQASWLLAGEVRLDGGGGQKADVIRAGSPRAAHRLSGPPLATASAQCLTDVELLAVDGSLLDLLLTWDQSDACEVAGIEDAMTDDWMTRLLQAPAFQRLPPTNLHALFQRLQPVDVKAGERVIRQGDAGDWFYVIVEGRCRIEHQGSHPRALTLAEFGPGDCFGEEALIGGLPRNASAVMLDDGRLMRLARRDFVELLNEPLLLRLGPGAAQARVDAGSARWLDVRLPGEFEEGHLPGSRNLPLRLLRAKAGSLERELLHVCVCDSGRRSAVAAFLLTQRGYSAAVLDSR